MILVLVSRVFCAKVFFFSNNQNMIDITGYLAVHFTVMMKFFPFFLTIKQSHPNSAPPWRVTGKRRKLKNPKICFPLSEWEWWIVHDYSEQHPPFVHFFRIRHCCIKKGHGQQALWEYDEEAG